MADYGPIPLDDKFIVGSPEMDRPGDSPELLLHLHLWPSANRRLIVPAPDLFLQHAGEDDPADERRNRPSGSVIDTCCG
jgi:hypothetical protein